MRTLFSIFFSCATLSGCAIDFDSLPRTESGRIDEDQIKRDIDIDLTPNLRIDTENGELLFECKILDWWCVKDDKDKS